MTEEETHLYDIFDPETGEFAFTEETTFKEACYYASNGYMVKRRQNDTL